MSQKSDLGGGTLDYVAVPLWPTPIRESTESEGVIDPTYLPFTPSKLLEHFAPVAGRGDPNRYLTYYATSQRNRRDFRESNDTGLALRDPGSSGWGTRWRRTSGSGLSQR